MPIEIEGTGSGNIAPWSRIPFVDGLVRLMMGIAMAIAALPNQFWGLIILCVGAYMIQDADQRTLAIIGGIIAAGSSLCTTRIGKPTDKKDEK